MRPLQEKRQVGKRSQVRAGTALILELSREEQKGAESTTGQGRVCFKNYTQPTPICVGREIPAKGSGVHGYLQQLEGQAGL